MSGRNLRGLYAITDHRISGARLLHQVEQAVAGGVCAVQYRDKSSDRARRRRDAQALLALCRRAGVPLIVNDDIELAAAIRADGVHLGRDDPAIGESRALLGPGAIIGVSCYNDFASAIDAQRRGADYVAFGRFYASATKPKAVQADIGLIGRSKRELALPTVAIGGITPENGAALIDAGVDMLAVVEALFGRQDIAAACADFNRLFAAD